MTAGPAIPVGVEQVRAQNFPLDEEPVDSFGGHLEPACRRGRFGIDLGGQTLDEGQSFVVELLDRVADAHRRLSGLVALGSFHPDGEEREATEKLLARVGLGLHLELQVSESSGNLGLIFGRERDA